MRRVSRRAGVVTGGRFLAVLGLLMLGGGLLGGGAGAAPDLGWVGPPGNNGTIKVDGVPFDDAPNNEPHPGCTFQVDFYGFDQGQLYADVAFTGHPPTGDAVVLATDRVFVGEDDNGGGGSEAGLDASVTYDLAAALTGVAPHPQQGWHVKLTIHADGSQGADVKHKMFWIAACAAGGTTTTSTTTTVGPTTTTTLDTTTTTVETTTTTVAPATTTTVAGGAGTGGTPTTTTVPPTTTVVAGGSVAGPETTTTTEVASPTTTLAAGGGPSPSTSTPAAAVLGVEITRPAGPAAGVGAVVAGAPARREQLAATGSATSRLLVLAGFALTLGGIALMAAEPRVSLPFRGVTLRKWM